ncbi:MAG: hypothetical protein FGM32_07510 [Candidatus Kapabacteria bacterium]|nr:hypothetical protein [Candidatus Kapabacteria bacterium]
MLSRLQMLLFITALISASCSSDVTSTGGDASPLMRVDSIGYYSTARVQAIKDSVLDIFMGSSTMKAPEFRDQFLNAKSGVKLYKVTYSSVIPEKNNAPVTATGLMAIPDNVQPGAPIVSYQHGTVFYREWRATNPNGALEVQMMISQFAAQGYIVICADYFGVPQEDGLPNSYCVPGSTAQACYDMYLASKQALKNMNITTGKLFVNGWSQGGYSTYAFLRKLEGENVPVAGAATASGPSDPMQYVRQLVYNPTPFAAEWVIPVVSNFILAYDNYNLTNGYFEQAVKPEYQTVLRDLYAFKVPYEEFVAKVPHTFDSVYTQKFLDDTRDTTSTFMKALGNAQVYRWRMTTPLRSFISNRDEGIVAPISRRAADYQLSQGNTNVEIIDAGANADHRSVYLKSLINIKPWFDSLR